MIIINSLRSVSRTDKPIIQKKSKVCHHNASAICGYARAFAININLATYFNIDIVLYVVYINMVHP